MHWTKISDPADPIRYSIPELGATLSRTLAFISPSSWILELDSFDPREPTVSFDLGPHATFDDAEARIVSELGTLFATADSEEALRSACRACGIKLPAKLTTDLGRVAISGGVLVIRAGRRFELWKPTDGRGVQVGMMHQAATTIAFALLLGACASPGTADDGSDGTETGGSLVGSCGSTDLDCQGTSTCWTTADDWDSWAESIRPDQIDSADGAGISDAPIGEPVCWPGACAVNMLPCHALVGVRGELEADDGCAGHGPWDASGDIDGDCYAAFGHVVVRIR
jgi:hypothetical protein